MDDVSGDQCTNNQSGAALTQVAVKLNAGVGITETGVSLDDGIDAGIGYVNAVLAL